MKIIIYQGKNYGTSIKYKCQNDRGNTREIRNSKESIIKAAARFNVNPKTIMKWRKREDTKDLPMEPKKIKSTVLSEAEEEEIGPSESLRSCLLMTFCTACKILCLI
jgi:transposase-like protein